MLNSDCQDLVQVITDDNIPGHSRIVPHMAMPKRAHVQHDYALRVLSLKEKTSGRCTCITCSRACEDQVAVRSSCRPQGL